MKTMLVTMMKTILVSFFMMAASSSCLAQVEQSITVQLGQSQCTFNASTLMNGFVRPAPLGKLAANPLVIVKALDKCSIPLLIDLFKGAKILGVTITLNEVVTGTPKALLIIKLTNAFVTDIEDADAKATVPSEKVTLAYETIQIMDPIDGTSVTCDFATQVCG